MTVKFLANVLFAELLTMCNLLCSRNSNLHTMKNGENGTFLLNKRLHLGVIVNIWPLVLIKMEVALLNRVTPVLRE